MPLYMLDTNMASYAIKRNSKGLQSRLEGLGPHELLCLSSISEGELRFGVARKPEAATLRSTVEQFLQITQVLPWGSDEAAVYGKLRAAQMAKGKPLDVLDLMIAAHAISLGAVLVTRDQAFGFLGDALRVEDWATDLE